MLQTNTHLVPKESIQNAVFVTCPHISQVERSKLNNCWALEYIHLLLLELQILNNRLRLMVLIYLQWKNLGNHFALERFAKVLSGLILTVEIY